MSKRERGLCFIKSCSWTSWLLYCCVFINLANGYSVKNCTIRGSLKYAVNINVFCNKRSLHFVPGNIPDKATHLDVSDNVIQKIKKEYFSQLSNLKSLIAQHNKIREVEEGAFSSLVNLQELNLACNKLTDILGGMFQNLGNLTVLRLNENLITNINFSAFSPLISLRKVNLSRNHLNKISKVQPLFLLPQLQEVHIGINGFTSFQTSEVSNISLRLKVLDLFQNPLKVFSITADIFPLLDNLVLAFITENMIWDVQDKRYLQSVQHLNLSGLQLPLEKITDLLQTFNSSLASLRLHSLGDVKVRALIRNVCLISSLKFLGLQWNNITSISKDEMQFCTQLTELDLSNNRLYSVPAIVSSLPGLRLLDLTFNQIKNISCVDFSNLTQLRTLQIFRNDISLIENFAFKDLKNLVTLIIRSNRLLLNGYFKKDLHKLESLDLANNKLDSVHSGDFESLKSLRNLSLSDNQILFIEPGSFNGLTNLIFLNLQSNKLSQSSIKDSVFSRLPNLKSLLLNNNYISYDSQEALVQPPFRYLKKLKILNIFSQGHKGMCYLPSNLFKGLWSLEELQAENLNINSLHPDTFTYTPYLWVLDLSRNDFISLTTKEFLPLQVLKTLHLSKVGLQSLDFLINANLSKLHLLHASKNALSVINETLIQSLPTLIYLDLQANYLSCDCTNAWFVNWTISSNDTEVESGYELTCNYPDKLKGHKLLDLDVGSCNVDVGFFCFISTTTLVSLTLLGSFLFHFLKWQVIYAYYLLLAFLHDNKQQRKLNGLQYDAFISYNVHDELWVMRELVPQLEGEQGWKLCLHHRDFEPGKPIMDNIVDGIYNSRKTICVISRHYLESEWCSREIQVASFRLFDEKKDVLILVFLENIPCHQLSPYYRMKRLIQKKTYISWPKPGEDTRVFWQKLRIALETKGTSEMEHPISWDLGVI
ncbi:toll-like receptor 13 [Rhinichthys klamathensis goyatoka]|uniref:toll-like receptor 13 n=1 Tax=Rhinichthys klamathensis goyatoka TaxID=3034132 RepID=UPI0024B61A82|nr:toll-like receptor 13 [Rhinichthys klamathensis goyatoka]